MIIEETGLKGSYLIEPKVIGDHRGLFFESFNKAKFYDATGIEVNVVQENQSMSHKGVLRGMHFQIGEMAQSKIVRVLQGEVQDVIIDLRKSSATFGQHFSVLLSAENRRQLYVPKGFAHGFLILSEQAEFFYCIDNPYSPAHERGLMYNDPVFNIDWGISQESILLSGRDQEWPSFQLNDSYFE